MSVSDEELLAASQYREALDNPEQLSDISDEDLVEA